MYPFSRIVTIFLSALLSAGINASAAEEIAISEPVVPAPPAAAAGTLLPELPLKEAALFTVNSLPLAPSRQQLKTAPTTVELYQHDEEPIGSRQPLLMLHGLNGEYREGFRWEQVVQELLKDSQFRERFKIYYARFNTYNRLSTTKPLFKKAIRDLHFHAGERPIVIVALSMGGNLVQEAMEDADVHRYIDKVITMGTPFHGSPLFCYDWMRYAMIRAHDLPWVRADLCMSYKLYFSKHPNLLADLRWDNADKGIPSVGKFKTRIPFSISGNLTPERMDNPRIARVNDEVKIDKSKFICYGGYLLTPYVTPHKPRAWRKAVGWPWWFITCTVPYHMAFEHPVLRALNYEMGTLPVADGHSGQAVLGSSRYSLNDGITPLVSALFLPSDVMASRPINREPDIKTIRDSIDVRKGRAFRQIDHITFVDGYRPEGLSKEIRDELAPEQAPRTIFQWLLTDLLDREEAIVNSENNLEASRL